MGAEISSILYQPYKGHLMFLCPGCNKHHIVKVNNNEDKKGWEWNRDIMFPTFTPSIKVEYVKPTSQGLAMLRLNLPLPPGQTRYPCTDEVCHSFVKDGNIEFLYDSTHRLAGRIVPLEAHRIKP
jgi:hypothetical protein